MIYLFKKFIMKKIRMLVLMMLISISTFAKEPNVMDGIKEAAKGVAWMVKVEVCKISYVFGVGRVTIVHITTIAKP